MCIKSYVVFKVSTIIFFMEFYGINRRLWNPLITYPSKVIEVHFNALYIRLSIQIVRLISPPYFNIIICYIESPFIKTLFIFSYFIKINNSRALHSIYYSIWKTWSNCIIYRRTILRFIYVNCRVFLTIIV